MNELMQENSVQTVCEIAQQLTISLSVLSEYGIQILKVKWFPKGVIYETFENQNKLRNEIYPILVEYLLASKIGSYVTARINLDENLAGYHEVGSVFYVF